MMNTARPAAASTRARSACITGRGWKLIRSKRNESIRYCVAQVTTESVISLAIMRFSAAVFSQHVEWVTSPVASSRW